MCAAYVNNTCTSAG